MKRFYEVTATVNADEVTSTETAIVQATDPDDACGAALGKLRERFDDDADISIRRIARQDVGNSPVAVAA